MGVRIAKIIAMVVLQVMALVAIAQSAPNPGVVYPDGMRHYAVGFSGLDFPTIFVNRGQHCLIVLDKGELLPPASMNPVLVADHQRWVAVESAAGGQRLPSGATVPIQWSIAVEPGIDATRTVMTIQTAMGNRYVVNLVAVGSMTYTSPQAQQLAGFYLYHAPVPMRVAVGRRQATAR